MQMLAVILNSLIHFFGMLAQTDIVQSIINFFSKS